MATLLPILDNSMLARSSVIWFWSQLCKNNLCLNFIIVQQSQTTCHYFYPSASVKLTCLGLYKAATAIHRPFLFVDGQWCFSFETTTIFSFPQVCSWSLDVSCINSMMEAWASMGISFHFKPLPLVSNTCPDWDLIFANSCNGSHSTIQLVPLVLKSYKANHARTCQL